MTIENTSVKTVEKAAVKFPELLRNISKEAAKKLLGDYGVNPDVLRGNYGERGLLVLLAFINNPCVTKQKLAEGFGVSLSTIEKDVNKLKKSGYVQHKGTDKGGHWEIAEQNMK